MLKKLLNWGEGRAHRQMVSAAGNYGANVHAKVRVADVVDIVGLRREMRTYALMAHFDFVVADAEHRPNFAVEFDGPGHNPINDSKKDEICRCADLALFRVDLKLASSNTGKLSFLNYLVHLWFLALKFEELRAAGDVPNDEPFMISGFLKPNAKHIFDSDFDLLGPALGKISTFCKRNNAGRLCLPHLPIGWLLMGNNCGEFASFSIFPVKHTKLYGRATLGLKIPNFGCLGEVQFSKQELGQFCTALAIEDLLEELKIYHTGSGNILRRQDEVRDEIETLLDRGFSSLMAMSMGDDELARFSYRRSIAPNGS